MRELCYPVLIALTLATPAIADSPFDLQGLAHFWEVVSTLQKDETVSEERWQALFATPGYAQLVERDSADRLLRKLLPLTFMPSKASEREAALAGELAFFVQAYQEAVAQRGVLTAFVRKLAAGDLQARAFARAAPWLPGNVTHGAKPPEVSFVIFRLDANGYERVVVDALLAHSFGEALLVDLLAHEMHHVLRNRVKTAPAAGLPEKDLLHALHNLQAEGVADHIDKADFLARDDWGDSLVPRTIGGMAERLRAAGEQADEELAAVDGLLVAYLMDPSAAAETGKSLRQLLTMGGHPAGYHMARTIVAGLGRERLIQNVADPFAFVADYNEAAAKLGGRHVLSEYAMKAIERLREAAGQP